MRTQSIQNGQAMRLASEKRPNGTGDVVVVVRIHEHDGRYRYTGIDSTGCRVTIYEGAAVRVAPFKIGGNDYFADLEMRRDIRAEAAHAIESGDVSSVCRMMADGLKVGRIVPVDFTHQVARDKVREWLKPAGAISEHTWRMLVAMNRGGELTIPDIAAAAGDDPHVPLSVYEFRKNLVFG